MRPAVFLTPLNAQFWDTANQLINAYRLVAKTSRSGQEKELWAARQLVVERFRDDMVDHHDLEVIRETTINLWKERRAILAQYVLTDEEAWDEWVGGEPHPDGFEAVLDQCLEQELLDRERWDRWISGGGSCERAERTD